jgi:curved DNA-binding protein CbpA
MHIGTMKLDSAYFDKVRIDRGDAAPVAPAPRLRRCQAQGCTAEGCHRAPKGRHAEGEYLWFCLDHVRLYNKSYNYFAGMNDAAIQAFQKEAVIGHRPTWRMGGEPDGPQPGGRAKYGWAKQAHDPFRLFGDGFEAQRPEPERRQVHNMEAKSLRTLGLDRHATAADVKARYKLLVKRHHPDANGGDRSLEDRLREIIQAYSYLKSVGFC